MKWKLLDETDGRRTFVLVFDIDDDPLEGLQQFAAEQELRGSHFSALGALREVTLGWWSWEEKDYRRIELNEQIEVLALTGNIADAPDGGRKVHAHIVVGRSDGTAHGGHLLGGRVRPTLEVTLVESPGHLRRRDDPDTGLALIDA